MKIPMTNIRKTLFQLPHIYNRLKYNEVVWIGTRVSIFLMAVFDVLLGKEEVLLDPPTSSQISREQKHNYFSRLIENDNIICLQESSWEGLNFFMLFKYLATTFPTLWYVYIPDNANASGSAICIHKDLLPDDAVVTHVVTCQGRDHVVNVRSGCQSLVIVNVHFEPELTLRSLRERLRLITPHWPHYPDAIGTIMGDFNICEPEEGRFNVWNQTSPTVTRERLPYFILCFLMFSKLPSLIIQMRDSSVNGAFRTLSRIDGTFINLPMAEARDFHCYSHVFENFGPRSIPSDHAAVRVVIQKPTIRGHQGKRIPSWMS